MTELDPFQHTTLRWLDYNAGRGCIADPVGSRKTATTLTWLAQQASPFEPLDVLLVVPGSVFGHWSRQAQEWAFGFDFDSCIGTPLKRAKIREQQRSGDGCGRIICTNYSLMLRSMHHLERMKFNAVVFDEGHRLKGRTTQTALVATKLAKTAKHCIMLTGTPVMNHASELWQYLHMLAPKVYTSFWRWAYEHFVIEEAYFNPGFPTKIIHGYRPGHLEIVRKQIEPFIIQRDLAELFPGQPWIVEPEHVSINVALSPVERKAYDSLVEHSWVKLDEGEVVTGGSLDLTTRLTQFVSDWQSLGGTGAGTKVTAAAELIDDLVDRDEKVLVLCKYKATVNALSSALRTLAAVYHGDMTAEQRDMAADRFEHDDRLPPPGTILTRPYKGRLLQVQVLPEGFEYDGQVYASLSAVAKAITGSHCNGFLFFKGCLNQGANP